MPKPLPRGPWFLNAFLQLGISVALAALAQVFLKLGSSQGSTGFLFNVAALRSPWVWLGIVSILASLASWLYALRFVPLLIAFNLAAATHVVVPLACLIFLGEQVPLVRWVGILSVTLGVVVIAQPVSRIEEHV
ncbi:MAG: hypothetical protein WB586_16825 [Chthoniobacterales bacterium]